MTGSVKNTLNWALNEVFHQLLKKNTRHLHDCHCPYVHQGLKVWGRGMLGRVAPPTGLLLASIFISLFGTKKQSSGFWTRSELQDCRHHFYLSIKHTE